MRKVKSSNAVFPQRDIMHMIATWKALDDSEKRVALAPDNATYKRRIMETIAQKSTPLFIAFAVGEHYPKPMEFAEKCRERVPVWVAALKLDKVPQVFSFFSICTCAVMRQIQAQEAKEAAQ